MNASRFLALVLLLAFTPYAVAGAPPNPQAEAPARAIAIVINGQPLDTDVAPRILSGRLMVPMRVVFDALGVEVSRAGKTITGQLPSGKVVLGVGDSQAVVNGRAVGLDAPAVDLDGNTFVPLRFIADALGATVSYDARGARVEIVSPLIGRNDADQSARTARCAYAASSPTSIAMVSRQP